MDAVEFFKEAKRMCRVIDCDECPFSGEECGLIGADNLEERVKTVEKWAAEHPGDTRQSEFLKMFPNAAIKNGAINIYPCDVDPLEIPQNGCYCESIKGKCDICRKAYWLAEVD